MQEVETTRDPKGRFLRGRPKGIKETRPRARVLLPILERQALAATATEMVAAKAMPVLDGVVSKLAEKALDGDVQAANILLRYSVVPVSKTVVRGLEGIAHLPPDQRIQAIAQAVAAGKVPVEDAAAVTALAKAEIEARILAPLRAALMAMKAGKAAGEVLAQLAEVLDDVVIDVDARLLDSPPPDDDDPAAGLI
jgi:hypothetical protein